MTRYTNIGSYWSKMEQRKTKQGSYVVERYVGACGLEPQTSTVSTRPRGLPKYAEVAQNIIHCGLECGLEIDTETSPFCILNGDICGLDKGRRDLIVGSSFGGTANLPECASGAKQSLVPSWSIQIWKMPGKRVMVSAYQSMRLAIVSANRP